jgi:hypothetical protein
VEPVDGPLELFVTLNRILENFHTLSNQYPDTFLAISLTIRVICIVVGILIAVKRFIASRGDPITIDLRTESTLTQGSPAEIQSVRPKTICREVNYFNHFFATAEKAAHGDEVFCSVWPGPALRRPVGNVLPRLAELCARRGLKATYFLNFTADEFSQIAVPALLNLLKHYSFATVYLVILSDLERMSYGVPQRSRFNIVLFPQQRIAYTHRRDSNGTFTAARQHEGESYDQHQEIIEQLHYVTISTNEAISRCRRHGHKDAA